jgi:hypothetical protein
MVKIDFGSWALPEGTLSEFGREVVRAEAVLDDRRA